MKLGAASLRHGMRGNSIYFATDPYNAFLRGQVIKAQAAKMREERNIALSCGYSFVVGGSTEAHKEALEHAASELEIVVTGYKR